MGAARLQGRRTARLGALARGMAFLLVPALAACGANRPPPPCPVAATVADAATLTTYRPGEGRDLTDVTFEAAIAGAVTGCVFKEDKLQVDLRVEILAQRGPADRDRVGEFQYFVAIATSERTILAKEFFTVRVDFPDNRRRAGVFEEIGEVIFLKPGQTGSDYSIFVGFQLSPEQLEENRQRR